MICMILTSPASVFASPSDYSNDGQVHSPLSAIGLGREGHEEALFPETSVSRKAPLAFHGL